MINTKWQCLSKPPSLFYIFLKTTLTLQEPTMQQDIHCDHEHFIQGRRKCRLLATNIEDLRM